MHFAREGRNAWLNRPKKKSFFQGFLTYVDKIGTWKMFIALLELFIVIERQVSLN